MNTSRTEKRTPEVVVVTGASAGVGRAVVREFARAGAWLGLIARGRDGLEGARREVEELGGRAVVLPLDVADAEAVDRAAERVEHELGPIDVWVNDAMVSVFSPVAKMTAADYRRVTEVTYLGVVHGTLAALRHMLRAIAARSCRWDRPWPIAAFPFNRPIAVPSTRSRASPNRSDANSFTTTARSRSRWCSSPRSIRLSSIGRNRECRARPSPFLRSISRRYRLARSTTRLTTIDVNGTSVS